MGLGAWSLAFLLRQHVEYYSSYTCMSCMGEFIPIKVMIVTNLFANGLLAYLTVSHTHPKACNKLRNLARQWQTHRSCNTFVTPITMKVYNVNMYYLQSEKHIAYIIIVGFNYIPLVCLMFGMLVAYSADDWGTQFSIAVFPFSPFLCTH